jgi:ABC-2 type transport system ATP-binding protein
MWGWQSSDGLDKPITEQASRETRTSKAWRYTVIEVQQLTKRYGPFTAVDGVSFNVGKGEILGFLGPNGAGKTTTMRILTGYMPPTEGRARVAGFDLQEQPVQAKLRIGYLPETPPLYPDMTVREYLRFVARIKGVPVGDQPARVDAVMRRTHVADMATRHCGKLSKGYKQRVGLAQALIHNPDVLVLDEPTAGLDPKQIIETRELIRSLAGDHTIVLSTHILPEVAQTCQRVVIINKGRVVAEDTPENLTGRLQGAASVYVEIDAQGVDPQPVLTAIPGVTSVSVTTRHSTSTGFEVQSERGLDVRRSVAQAVVGAGLGLVELRPMRMSLEEVFLQLTTTDVPSEEVARA